MSAIHFLNRATSALSAAILQTAEGAFEQVINVLFRMKELATQFNAPDTTTTALSGSLSGDGMIDKAHAVLAAVSDIRSALAANINCLCHTASNLSHMTDNTDIGLGHLRDADFAKEGSQMSRQQMLMQSSQRMLKQPNGVGQRVPG